MSKKNKEKKAKKERKGFFGEFKEFISRGNVIDMSVGVVVGGAFTAIVNSLVKDIINPALGCLIGKMDLSAYKLDLSEDSALLYGSFIQSIINFLITAFVLFLFVRTINKVREKAQAKKAAEEAAAKAAEPAPEPTPDPQVVLLTEIRDLLQNKD